MRWNAQAEALWPGILYVGASRPEKEHNFALDFDISRSDLKKVGASARWRKQHAEVERIHEAARVLCETNESLDERSAVGDATECPWGSRQDFFFRLTSFCLSAKAQLDAKQDLGEAIKKEVEDCLGQWQASLRQELSTWSEEDRAKWAPTFEENGWVEFIKSCTKRRRVWSSSSGEDSDNNKNKKFKSPWRHRWGSIPLRLLQKELTVDFKISTLPSYQQGHYHHTLDYHHTHRPPREGLE